MLNKWRFLQIMLIVPLLYASSACIVTVAGKGLARDHRGILSIASFQRGIFSWSYKFIDGVVGPFAIGQTKADAVKIARSEKFTVYPVDRDAPAEPLIDIDEARIANFIDPMGNMIIDRNEKMTGRVRYQLNFVNDKVRQVVVSRHFLSGL